MIIHYTLLITKRTAKAINITFLIFWIFHVDIRIQSLSKDFYSLPKRDLTFALRFWEVIYKLWNVLLDKSIFGYSNTMLNVLRIWFAVGICSTNISTVSWEADIEVGYRSTKLCAVAPDKDMTPRLWRVQSFGNILSIVTRESLESGSFTNVLPSWPRSHSTLLLSYFNGYAFRETNYKSEWNSFLGIHWVFLKY